jgi:hypothetical protein
VKLTTGLLAVVCGGTITGAGTITIADDLVTVPDELLALIVYTVVVAGDTTLVPAILTWPMPWSILTELAPLTFHIRVDTPPELIVDGLLLKDPITGGAATGGAGYVTGDAGNVKQPGATTSSNSDRERIINLFNLVTSKIIFIATSICH